MINYLSLLNMTLFAVSPSLQSSIPSIFFSEFDTLSSQSSSFPLAVLISTSPAAWQPSLGQQHHLQPPQRGQRGLRPLKSLGMRWLGRRGADHPAGFALAS